MLNRSLTLTALFLTLATPVLAQPAVPAVPPQPLPGRPDGSVPTSAPAPLAAPVTAPASSLDAPPTSSDLPPTTAPTASVPAPLASAPPAPVNPDDPPTTDVAPAPLASPAAPAATASAAAPAALDAPPSASAEDAAAPTADSLQTVARNYPLTPEGNAAFLAAYRARPDVTTLPSGVMYRTLVTGKGTVTPISRMDTVTVSYRGWLINGTSFDSSVPGSPRAFQLSSLIEGWREALLQMKVGDLWEVVIPAELAYGVDGRPGHIPANQTLIFVISVAKIEYAG